MKAIILAAGRGSRMKELTKDSPKCLLDLHGKSLLDLQCEAIRNEGIDEIGIVTGYMREMLSNRGLTEFHNPRWAQTNMVMSLACASEWLQSSTCIISYSDIFYDSLAVRLLLNCNSAIALTYDSNWLKLWTNRFGDPLIDAETFCLSTDGILTEIGNKPNSLDEVHGQYMGLLRFTPKGWAETLTILSTLSTLERDKIDITHLLQLIIKSKKIPLKALSFKGIWGEIDSEFDLTLYRNEK